MSHVRYPADLFKVQRSVLGQYHVTDAGSFYSRDDAWTTPNDPTSPSSNPTLQPPYYLTMQMPGQDAPSFSLYSTFIPLATSESSRSVLKGYLAVDADAGDTKGKKASGYGKLRLLHAAVERHRARARARCRTSSTPIPSVSQAAEPAAAGQDRRHQRQPADAARSAADCSTCSRST